MSHLESIYRKQVALPREIWRNPFRSLLKDSENS
jgi:hypothetical protein